LELADKANAEAARKVKESETLREPPSASIDENIHRQEPSWEDEMREASSRHRETSPARSAASVQTVFENVSDDSDEIYVMICEHCRNRIDNGANVILSAEEDRGITERPDETNTQQ